MISLRFSTKLRQFFARNQKALSELCSCNRHAPITTKSRVVMENQFLRYKSGVMFLIRMRNRFFTECILMTAGKALRLPGRTART